ncbi:Protein zinc induced facilitator-like 1 [Vitis vinifera]|uniref:protein Zinc induced FACILITATOR-LIKE 1 n=1 Tax=Vitis vinifera TaxID=29760 RepID=A0A438EBD3_VITVI|nr:Protein ZINC INDUCED FACILITATOR-like 1 [Vitis vinifera]RVX06629.1 Protein zinc induced facilitator-like 1 [Vitis vinifera]
MKEEQREVLLKKVYHGGCPGCRVEHLKDTQRGLPVRQLFFVWIVVLCNGNYTLSYYYYYTAILSYHHLPSIEPSSMVGAHYHVSFICICRKLQLHSSCTIIARRDIIIQVDDQDVHIVEILEHVCKQCLNNVSILLDIMLNSYQIRDFNIAKTEKDIGYYAGYAGASYMFGRALTSILWGMVADRYGRKPVILVGTASVVIFNTLFGLSLNYWMAISSRFLLGSMSTLLGPIMAYATEIFREEYQALGLSTINTAWGVGLIIGPALGGFLAQVLIFPPFLCKKYGSYKKLKYWKLAAAGNIN